MDPGTASERFKKWPRLRQAGKFTNPRFQQTNVFNNRGQTPASNDAHFPGHFSFPGTAFHSWEFPGFKFSYM